MSVHDDYSVDELRDLANCARAAGIGEKGLRIYNLLFYLALEKEHTPKQMPHLRTYTST